MAAEKRVGRNNDIIIILLSLYGNRYILYYIEWCVRGGGAARENARHEILWDLLIFWLLWINNYNNNCYSKRIWYVIII